MWPPVSLKRTTCMPSWIIGVSSMLRFSPSDSTTSRWYEPTKVSPNTKFCLISLIETMNSFFAMSGGLSSVLATALGRLATSRPAAKPVAMSRVALKVLGFTAGLRCGRGLNRFDAMRLALGLHALGLMNTGVTSARKVSAGGGSVALNYLGI